MSNIILIDLNKINVCSICDEYYSDDYKKTWYCSIEEKKEKCIKTRDIIKLIDNAKIKNTIDDLHKLKQIIPEDRLIKVWGNANFGDDNTYIKKLDLLAEAIRKDIIFGEHGNGFTIKSICGELGLLKTDKGLNFLKEYWQVRKDN